MWVKKLFDYNLFITSEKVSFQLGSALKRCLKITQTKFSQLSLLHSLFDYYKTQHCYYDFIGSSKALY